MEANFSDGSMFPDYSSFAPLNLQGSIPINLLQQPNHTQQGSMINPMPNFNNVFRGKNSASEEDEPNSFNEEPHKGNNLALWHRVKWTGPMVKLLITAVSYIDEENLQKTGKWRPVSKVMSERGFCVSPQQCEDKFNGLNKRYKKLNDILGRGTSCQVVENPLLLGMIDHLTEKSKDEVKKILSSKHLFYEEMCSYHNLNRLHLPHDPELQRSVQMAIRSRDNLDEDDGESDDHDEKWMKSRLVELEKQKMEMKMEMIEMEKQKFKWENFIRKKDWDLEKMRMENERMRIENEQMAMELKRMEYAQ